MKNTIKKINNKTWDLSLLVQDDFLKKRKKVTLAYNKFLAKWENRVDWLKDSKILKLALDDYEHLLRFNSLNEEYYYWLRSQVEENNTQVTAKFNQINSFSIDLSNKLRFFELRLSCLSKNIQAKFIADKALRPYKHFLERLFAQSNYLLTEPEERIMHLKEQTSHSNWVKMTSSFLSTEKAEISSTNGKKTLKSFSEILSLISSQNKEVGESAAQALNRILKNNIKIGENELNSILANKKVDDELRRMNRPDLARHLRDDISSSVVDVMIKVVADNFGVARRYYKLKAQLLKTKQLKYHERNVPIGKLQIKYSYEKAKKILRNVLVNLDTEFLDIFNNFDKNNNIDVYSRPGKRSGAFCASESVSWPTFIMLNHNNKLNDVLTLAHEVGHGINNEMMRSRQNSLNFGSTLATAEVASTFFEDFVLQAMIKEVDDETRLEIMVEKLNGDIITIFRQAALYLFEKELHQQFRIKGYLDSNEIGSLFKKHMSAYMGSAVEQSRGAENWWLYWGHIRSFFYVYSYVSGSLISKYLQNQVSNDKKFVEEIKYFLSAGLSESPQDIFSNLGININDQSFWEKGVGGIKKLLTETEKLAKKLKKI